MSNHPPSQEDRRPSRLEKAVESATEHLYAASAQFAFYASEHMKKQTEEGRKKAKVNLDCAFDCFAAAQELSFTAGPDEI